MLKRQPEKLTVPGYEEVYSYQDPGVGLSAIIAVHNRNLGPACGGVRMLPYASHHEALDDVLRLSKGMSYKSALAGIGFGGGKSVIMLDPNKKTPALFEAFAGFVDFLEGRYISAKDMNVTNGDLALIKKNTKHVLGIEGEPGSSGDPSPVTALGVFRAMEATAQELFGSRSLKDKRVAIQGLGYVGLRLGQYVRDAGARLFVTDIDAKKIERATQEWGAAAVPLDQIHRVECDIFSPNARGAILNAKTIPELRCQAVVGAANNQLATPEDGALLFNRKILYAPDFAVNSGGIINIFVEYEGYNRQKALEKTENIFQTIQEIFKRSKEQQVSPAVIAEQLAEERLYAKK